MSPNAHVPGVYLHEGDEWIHFKFTLKIHTGSVGGVTAARSCSVTES